MADYSDMFGTYEGDNEIDDTSDETDVEETESEETEPDIEEGGDSNDEEPDTEDNEPSEVIDTEDQGEQNTGEPIQRQTEPPEWVPETLRVPEFKDTDSELAWYRENYAKTFDAYKDESFQTKLTEFYADTLKNVEENHENLKAIEALLKDKPEIAIKLYAPQFLAKNGYNNLITQEQTNVVVDDILKEKFGQDYRDVYDPAAATQKGTLSNKILQEQNDIIANINQKNQVAQQYIEQYKPPSDEDIQKQFDEDYNTHFKSSGFAKEEYDTFINESREYFTKKPLSGADMHLIMNKDMYLEDAYKKGVKDGKKGVTKDMERELKNFQPEYKASKSNRRNGLTEFKRFGNETTTFPFLSHS